MNIPSQTILTNELKLHDYKGVKLSITFGDADINDGYSYGRINFKALESKLDFLIDKPILNFITNGLTLNDNPVWNLAQQGPNTGMNSDMVDGLHAYDLKDRLGSHHYIHMMNTSSKRFVKIATLNPRRVGNPADFRADGKSPYTGIFSNLELRDKIGEFKANTPYNLENAKNTTFQTTNMVSEGAYNSCLRGSVTILKNTNPTTIDFHIGLFSDPTETSKDGWTSVKKFFYASCHDKNIPYINNGTASSYSSTDITETELYEVEEVNEEISATSDVEIDNTDSSIQDRPTTMHYVSSADKSSSSISENHTRPAIDKSGYVTPPDVGKNYYPPAPFPPIQPEGESYDKYLEIFRLYYVGTKTEIIDGLQVVTHNYELYMAIDSKTEFHIIPYMSNGAFLYNFETPILESQLPSTSRFLRAKSIYDDRYAYKYHRHEDYESKITDLYNEIDDMWDQFGCYVQITQGNSNAKKVLMTDNYGVVFPAKDNFERHEDSRRYGNKVLVSTSSKCIGESEISASDISQLQGIEGNIQSQIHKIISDMSLVKGDLENKIDDIYIPDPPDVSGFVKKTGDTMTGHLSLSGMSQLRFTPDGKLIYLYAGDTSYKFGIVAEGINVLRYNNANSCLELGSSSIMLGTKKISIGSTAPASPNNGDVWIKNV